MLRSGMCRWRPADGWQGTGATHVATNAATQLSRLSRTSKTKLHFKSLDTIAKMLAFCVICNSPIYTCDTDFVFATFLLGLSALFYFRVSLGLVGRER